MSTPLYQIIHCEQCQRHNALLARWIMQMPAEAVRERTHFIYGRYENLYVDEAQAPGLKQILEAARQAAATILRRPVKRLRVGCWVNIMRQGDVTSCHTHDDFDELLSGTYYIQAPESSGELVLYDKGAPIRIAPRSGSFVFFSPTLEHEVLCHTPKAPRLSLGFNVGLQTP